VGRKSLSSGVATFIDSYPDPGDLFATGRALARQWVNRQLETESGTTHLRGLLLCQGSSLRPEMMLEAINSMTPQGFIKGFSRLRGSQAVTVVGTR
jgi:hypothetical protein